MFGRILLTIICALSLSCFLNDIKNIGWKEYREWCVFALNVQKRFSKMCANKNILCRRERNFNIPISSSVHHNNQWNYVGNITDNSHLPRNKYLQLLLESLFTSNLVIYDLNCAQLKRIMLQLLWIMSLRPSATFFFHIPILVAFD